MKQTIFLDLVT